MVNDDRAPRCQYQTCRMIARVLLVVELGPFPWNQYLCEQHQDRANELARQRRAVAYRLVPL
jgi:hypothetical protein